MSDDIARLFARDPLKHTDADIDAIIRHNRETRKTFKLTGKPAAKLTTAEAEVQKMNLKIDLGDI